MNFTTDFPEKDAIPDSEPESAESAAGWLVEHPEDQQHLEFPPEVNAFLTGNRMEENPAIVPLFRDLDPHEEAEFRAHARETYEVGMPIETIFHPVWQDEARKMNNEVAESSGASPEGT